MFNKLFIYAILAISLFTVKAGLALELTPENNVFLKGEVSEASISDTIKELIEKPKAVLFLDSPGGSVFAALPLLEYLENNPRTCVTNFSASMAFVIMQYCKERILTPYGIMMQHQAQIGFPQMPAENLISIAKLIESVTLKTDTVQAKRLKISNTEFKDKIRSDWWMFGREVLQNNAVDRIESVTCSKDLLNLTRTEKVQVFIFTLEVTYSKCPLVRKYDVKAEVNKEVSRALDIRYFGDFNK
jgi:ATP-dependent protease ClpP protease subunit